MIIYQLYTYLDLVVICVILLGICLLLVGMCFLVMERRVYAEKLGGYECGFDPFADAREPYNIKFYVVAMLFIVFDVELIYFFPMVLALANIGIFGCVIIYFFSILLILAYWYEVRCGIFDW